MDPNSAELSVTGARVTFAILLAQPYPARRRVTALLGHDAPQDIDTQFFGPRNHGLSRSFGKCARRPGATCRRTDERCAQGISKSAARVENGGWLSAQLSRGHAAACRALEMIGDSADASSLPPVSCSAFNARSGGHSVESRSCESRPFEMPILSASSVSDGAPSVSRYWLSVMDIRLD